MRDVQPQRGEVYDCRFPPPVGVHPGVVLVANALIPRFASLVVVLITGTDGPRPLRIPVGADAGLTGHTESHIDLTSIFTIGRGQLRRRRGRLSPRELDAVDQALATVLGLELADAD